MRKHAPLIGWPRRDPRHCRFPLPNAVWEYRLKPIEFVILCYLCCQHSHGGANLSPEMIAKGVRMTTVMVKKYLASLVGKGLIINECTPTFRCADSRKFFTLPNEIFLLGLPPSAFVVYAYLLLIETQKARLRASRIKADVTSDARQVTSARSADRFQGLPELSCGALVWRLFRAENLRMASDFTENTAVPTDWGGVYERLEVI